MNKDLIRLGILALFLLGMLVIAWMGGNMTGRTIYLSPFSDDTPPEAKALSQILEEKPVDQMVTVQGVVSRVLPGYTSEKGNEYQQFYVSDGIKELKVFCSRYRGSVSLEMGDNVTVTGRFQRYSSSYEIYAECRNVGFQS